MLDFVLPNGRTAIEHDFELLLKLLLDFVDTLHFSMNFLLFVVLVKKTPEELLHCIGREELGQEGLVRLLLFNNLLFFDLGPLFWLLGRGFSEDLILKAFDEIRVGN